MADFHNLHMRTYKVQIPEMNHHIEIDSHSKLPLWPLLDYVMQANMTDLPGLCHVGNLADLPRLCHGHGLTFIHMA